MYLLRTSQLVKLRQLYNKSSIIENEITPVLAYLIGCTV